MVDDPNDEDFVPFRPRRSPRMSLRSSVAQRASRSAVGATKMTCAHCRTPLQKGQTAYQRKGLPQLFCSSSCLTTFSKKPSGKKTCTFCKKYVRAARGGCGDEVITRQRKQQSGREAVWAGGLRAHPVTTDPGGHRGGSRGNETVVPSECSNPFPPAGRSGTPRTWLWHRQVQAAPSMNSAHPSASPCMRPSSSARSPRLGILPMPLAAAYARRQER